MFARKLFLLTCALALTSTVANAQWSSKMERRGARPQDTNINTVKQSSEEDDKTFLEGTWRGTETFGSDSFKILYTFGAGKNANNGIVVHSDELFLVGSPSCLSAQGVWKRTGERRFIATDEGFCFDTFNGFAPAGKIKFKVGITLNSQGNEFIGTEHVEAYDPDGTLVFTTDGTLHGVRMRAEAPTP